MNEPHREIVNDGTMALRALAKLMPQLSSHTTLQELLESINLNLGASLSWVTIDDGADMQRVVSAGDLSCHSFEVNDFLASTLLMRHHRSWRVICWKENMGRYLFSDRHPGYKQLRSGVLCKITPYDHPGSGYFFLGFAEPLSQLSVLKDIAAILAEKFKDYFTEIMARERTAKEMQRIVAQYKTLFERAPVLMNSFDRHSRCVLWNAECEKVFGWTLAEINAHADPLALFHPDPEVCRRVRESVNSAPLENMYEWHPVRRDGVQLTILWSNIRLPDGSILNIGLDITARKRAEKQLEMKATTDDLTGCFNRSAILQQLSIALEAGQRQAEGRPFSVLMFDLDFFKQINDQWGHTVGDAALIHFCDRIRELSPAGAALGRVGGEEFLLIMPDTHSEAAMQLSLTLRQALLGRPLNVGTKTLTLSFSAGVVEVNGGQQDASSLLIRADKALYDAKRAGRGKTVVAIDYL